MNEVKSKKTCRKCAKCCVGKGVGLTLDDLNREPRLWDYAVALARVGNIKMREYMIENNMPFALAQRRRGAPCVFLVGNNCLIYERRPEMCRSYQCRQ
jgi:Fe-S-cluster containining protein